MVEEVAGAAAVVAAASVDLAVAALVAVVPAAAGKPYCYQRKGPFVNTGCCSSILFRFHIV